MKHDKYQSHEYSVKEATKGSRANSSAFKIGNFNSGAKVVGKRKHNPNSADEALDGLYHNKATVHNVDYQGNVKMRKFHDRRESPDAKFVHQGENNVKEDRTIATNVRLFWSKLFQKSESQPANLKTSPTRCGTTRERRECGMISNRTTYELDRT